MGKQKNPSSKAIQEMVELAFARVDDAIKWDPAIQNEPITDLFAAWLGCHNRFKEMACPKARPPMANAEIEKVERRLDVTFPHELRSLYLASDGVDWIIPAGQTLLPLQGQFPPAKDICLAGGHAIPLSELIGRRIKSIKKADRPSQIPVHRPSVFAHFTEPEQMLSFDVLDRFLELQLHPTSTCLLMAHHSDLGFPVGTVLQVENLFATRFESLSHWLSANVRMFTVGVPAAK